MRPQKCCPSGDPQNTICQRMGCFPKDPCDALLPIWHPKFSPTISYCGLHERRPTSWVRKTYYQSDKVAMEYVVINDPHYDCCLRQYMAKRGVCSCNLYNN